MYLTLVLAAVIVSIKLINLVNDLHVSVDTPRYALRMIVAWFLMTDFTRRSYGLTCCCDHASGSSLTPLFGEGKCYNADELLIKYEMERKFTTSRVVHKFVAEEESCRVHKL